MSDKNDLSKIAATAPDHIWLDLGEEAHLVDDRTTFKDLAGVTWSEDNATGHGIEYLRADTISHPATQAGALQAVTDEQLDALWHQAEQTGLGHMSSRLRAHEFARLLLAAAQPNAAPGDGQGAYRQGYEQGWHDRACNSSHAFLGEPSTAATVNVWPQYIAGIIETYIQQNRTDEDRETGIAKIIERRLKYLASPSTATAAREQEADDCCRINTFKSSICAHGTKGCDLLHRPEAPAAPSAEPVPLNTMQIASCASAVRPYSTALLTVPAEELIAFVRNIEAAHGIASEPQPIAGSGGISSTEEK